jgi:hypothetical protein
MHKLEVDRSQSPTTRVIQLHLKALFCGGYIYKPPQNNALTASHLLQRCFGYCAHAQRGGGYAAGNDDDHAGPG